MKQNTYTVSVGDRGVSWYDSPYYTVYRRDIITGMSLFKGEPATELLTGYCEHCGQCYFREHLNMLSTAKNLSYYCDICYKSIVRLMKTARGWAEAAQEVESWCIVNALREMVKWSHVYECSGAQTSLDVDSDWWDVHIDQWKWK